MMLTSVKVFLQNRRGGNFMRGVHTFINDIRRQVFTEVARLAFEGGDYAKAIEHLPTKSFPAR